MDLGTMQSQSGAQSGAQSGTQTGAQASGPTSSAWRRPYGPVTLAELTAGLVWPALIKVPSLALQPPRLAVGVATAAALWLVSWLFDRSLVAMGGAPLARDLMLGMSTGLADAAWHLLSLRPADAVEAASGGTVRLLGVLASERPVALGVFLLTHVPVWMVGLGAVARMAAVDVAGHLNLPAREGLRFALRRWAALLGAAAIPLIIAGALALLLQAAGWVLLSLGGVSVLGAIAYGLALLIGLVLTLLLAGFVCGNVLLAPAVVIEGTDSADAVQRTYAYLTGRLARAVLYAAIALVQGAATFAVLRWALGAASDGAASLATGWLGPDRAAALMGGHEGGGVSAWIIGAWQGAFALLLPGAMISLYACSGAVLYLLLRRINDEQDISDVWSPESTSNTPARRQSFSAGGASSDAEDGGL